MESYGTVLTELTSSLTPDDDSEDYRDGKSSGDVKRTTKKKSKGVSRNWMQRDGPALLTDFRHHIYRDVSPRRSLGRS